jgi:cytidylate kinase
MSRSIEQLVNQQVLRWEEQRTAARRSTGPLREPAQPSLTISREFGALGGELGTRVARSLGFGFYAQELVHEIAKQAHVRQKIVESLDERLQSGITQWVAQKMDGGGFEPSDYLKNLSQVVLTVGRHGRSVIVGRGAHMILDSTQTLRVRCYAPLDWRVERIAERERLSLGAARERVQRVDAERRAFFRQHFAVDIGDPLHFDLLVNMATYSLEASTELVCHAFYARFGDPALAAAPPSRVVNKRPDVAAGVAERRAGAR